MSDEHRTEEETEVEGHVGDVRVNDEPIEDDDEGDVEAHVMRLPSARME